MRVELSAHDHDSLLTVTGNVDAVDVPMLRSHLLDAVEAYPGDVLLDMRHVRSVSEQLAPALTAVRTRAQHLRHRIVVIDDVAGATTGVLRRLGLQFRIPVYRDPQTATEGLRADREARDRLDALRRIATPFPPVPLPTVPLPLEAEDRWEQSPFDEAPDPPAQSGRALWDTAAPWLRGTGRRP